MLHSIARSEQAQLRAEVKELLSGIWGHLGFNDYASADLSIQAHALGLMADAMMQGNGYMNEVMTKIRKLDIDFGKLYEALSESRCDEAGPMTLRLDNIQVAIDRMDMTRKPLMVALQSERYGALRQQLA